MTNPDLNFKNIHIGQMIEGKIAESGIEISRICNFLKYSEKEMKEMYQEKSIDTEVLLRLSKLLGYDFFRIYSQHLILYAPPSAEKRDKEQDNKKSQVPQFRKNIYTKEVIEFILFLIFSKKMTANQAIERYRIPKTTLYKWITKYKDKGSQ